MPPDVILALDQGSSSTRCVAYERHMRRRGAARRVAPLLDDTGRARERSRWNDALEVHLQVDA